MGTWAGNILIEYFGNSVVILCGFAFISGYLGQQGLGFALKKELLDELQAIQVGGYSGNDGWDYNY